MSDETLPKTASYERLIQYFGNISSSSPYVNEVVEIQKATAKNQEISISNISKVLIIYTGGTIGMKACPHGYAPQANWFFKVLKSVHRFNDSKQSAPPLQCKIDRQGFLETLQTEALITPGIITIIIKVSIYGKRIHYAFLEYDPLLDSSNMNIDDWVKISSDIENNYRLFDAFVILHGTDTMAFTASALSFMLEELGKTVIITGSQVPISEWRTDAEQNILGALLIAGHFVIPEVCVYFCNKLFRGNRTTKIDALDFNSFDSPNLKPLATVGVNIGRFAILN
jgi:lysophospholipase